MHFDALRAKPAHVQIRAPVDADDLNAVRGQPQRRSLARTRET
ncbi:MAG: hypothetical protein WD805_03160 [Gaiellaceae bacterium]